ncbi:dihydrofolate reductase [Candidatus Giovannonibacteria bacterium]|nr:dihydrofolate reductase [Candidatus Giovannonibacteria bacterium]
MLERPNLERPNISVIAAVAENGVISAKGKLPWNLQADLALFRKFTLGKTLLAGRKTFEILWNKYGRFFFRDRKTVVLSKKFSFSAPHPCVKADSIEEAVEIASGTEEICAIGGQEVFEKTLPLADMLCLTEVHAKIHGDKFFPKINRADWEPILIQRNGFDEVNEFDYTYRTLRRATWKASYVELWNCRTQEQLDHMRRIRDEGICPFCPEYRKRFIEKTIKEWKYWTLTFNTFPLENTSPHLLAIYKDPHGRHIESILDMHDDAGTELLKLEKWAKVEYRSPGGVFAMREGNPRYSGSSIKHLHTHFIFAKHDASCPEYKKVAFGIV